MTIAKLPLAKDIDQFDFTGTPINEGLVRDLASGWRHRPGQDPPWHCHRPRAHSQSHAGSLLHVVDPETETCNGKQGRTADYLTRMDFVIFDEFGYLRFAQSGGQLLFHLISRLYERTSIIVTKNFAFGEWPSSSPTRRRRPPCSTVSPNNAQIVETGNEP